MDLKKCHAVYVDNRVQVPRCATQGNIVPEDEHCDELQSHELFNNIERFSDAFGEVHLYNTGKDFSTKLAELEDISTSDCTPIFAFIDIPSDSTTILPSPSARSSYSSRRPSANPSVLLRAPRGRNPSLTLPFEDNNDAYGLRLLSRSSADLQVQEGPTLILPIAVLREPPTGHHEYDDISRCLDSGAVDILTCPLDAEKLDAFKVHAYRTKRNAEKEKQRFLTPQNYRKQSWVGMDEQQPYGYLREAMVSKLLKGICNPETAIEEVVPPRPKLQENRRLLVESQVAEWTFSAHQFTDDELMHAGCVMLEHTLKMPGIDKWRLNEHQIYRFLFACRSAYNSFVLYHNFRHAIDVLQSTFYFLLASGMLPPYPHGRHQTPINSLAAICTPFEILTLIISAIGHDVGHPGVNNAFLINLKSPLAQLYNDSSVLEAFHCAAYSQILRRYWPAAFKDEGMRRLMISSILATDMGVHGKYMDMLASLKLKYETEPVESWTPKDLEDNRFVVCGLIIKCADISNVARQWSIAEKWTDILQQEFYNQGVMEKEVGMKTALFGGPPELGNMVELAKGQIGFMEFFALPLFQGVAELLDGMSYPATEIAKNLAMWREIASKGAVPVFKGEKAVPTSQRLVIPEEDAGRPAQVTVSPSRFDEEEESPTSPRIPGGFPQPDILDSINQKSTTQTPSNRTSIASRPSESLTAPWSSSTYNNNMTPISCQTEASSLSSPTASDEEERAAAEKAPAGVHDGYPVPYIKRSSATHATNPDEDVHVRPPPSPAPQKNIEHLTPDSSLHVTPNSTLQPAPATQHHARPPHTGGSSSGFQSQTSSTDDIAGKIPSRFSSLFTKLGGSSASNSNNGSATNSPRKSPSRFMLGGSPTPSMAGGLNIPGAYGDSDTHSHSSQSESNYQSGNSSQAAAAAASPGSAGKTLSKRISRLRLAFWRKGNSKPMDVET